LSARELAARRHRLTAGFVLIHGGAVAQTCEC
jgi:hypothetical protein